MLKVIIGVFDKEENLYETFIRMIEYVLTGVNVVVCTSRSNQIM